MERTDKGKLMRFHDRLKREGQALIRAARIVNKTTDCRLNGPENYAFRAMAY